METTGINVFEEVPQYLDPAPVSLRFVNHLVDMIVFYVFFFVCMFVIGLLLAVSGDANAGGLGESGGGMMLFYLLAFALMVVYYTLVEGASGGRSIGKLMTGTVAVREDGGRITWKDALLRSLCRLIPFEAFSAFGGHPWHDTMTKTMVVKKQA